MKNNNQTIDEPFGIDELYFPVELVTMKIDSFIVQRVEAYIIAARLYSNGDYETQHKLTKAMFEYDSKAKYHTGYFEFPIELLQYFTNAELRCQ